MIATVQSLANDWISVLNHQILYQMEDNSHLIYASGGLQECAEEDVSKADAHSAARTPGTFLNL